MEVFQILCTSPMDIIASEKGLTVRSKMAESVYPHLLILVSQGYATVNFDSGIMTVKLTEAGFRELLQYREIQNARLSGKWEVLEKVAKTENKVEANPPSPSLAGTKRFRDLSAKERFRIMAGKTVHSLYFRKLNDAEDDNAISDTETPTLASFPEDQLVYPAP